MVPGGSGNRLATLFHCAEFCRKHFQEGSTELQIGFAPNDTDRVAGRVPWYPTSREKRARCGTPDPLLPVQEAGHLIFQLASASRLLLMNNLLRRYGNELEAEGSGVPRTFPGNVFQKSVAQWVSCLKPCPWYPEGARGFEYVDGKPETARCVHRFLPHATHASERAPRRHPT
jgi:hypothetical protein